MKSKIKLWGFLLTVVFVLAFFITTIHALLIDQGNELDANSNSINGTARSTSLLVDQSRSTVQNFSLTPEKTRTDADKNTLMKKMVSLQMPFIENRGQIKDKSVKYYANIFAGSAYVTDKGEIFYRIIKSEPVEDVAGPAKAGNKNHPQRKITGSAVIRESLVQPAAESEKATEHKLLGLDKAQAVVNYFKGKKEEWRTNIPTWNEVSLGEVYKGIELRLKAYGKTVEKIFVVSPEGSVSDIGLNIDGAKSISLNKDGEIEVETELGTVKLTKPLVYQEIDGKRVEVASNYVIQDAGIQVSDASMPKDKANITISSTDHPLPQPALHTSTPKLSDLHSGLDKGVLQYAPTETSDSSLVTRHPSLSYGFQVASYDKTKPLIIDPVLSYSTFFGGSVDFGIVEDSGTGISVDSGGNAYITGYTYSHAADSFPVLNAYQGDHGGEFGDSDAFVAKFDASGGLLFSTFFGGTNHDHGNGISVDSGGNAYITGYTYSDAADSFPVLNAYQGDFGGGFATSDAFVAKFDASGGLLFSTYFGGSGAEVGYGISADSGGNVYIVGDTNSTAADSFPVLNAFQSDNAGSSDAFVAKFDSSGGLLFSTFFGGLDFDEGFAISVDSGDNAYITGNTYSTAAGSFPVFPTSTAYQTDNAGRLTLGTDDAFVAKFDSSGGLLFSTFFGGLGSDRGFAISVDSGDNAYITGHTYSYAAGSFPVFPTSTAYQTDNAGVKDAFVAKFDPSGDLLFSTFFGGSGDEVGHGISVDSGGNAYITGSTDSTAAGSFPVSNAIQTDNAGVADAFVAKFDASGGLLFSTFFGGSGNDIGNGISVDSGRNAYIVGHTLSTAAGSFPVRNEYQSENAGGWDAFIAKIGPETFTWLSAASGFWSDGSNWSGGFAPGTGDDVVIDVAGDYTVSMDVSVDINSLTLGGASGTQTLDVDELTLTLDSPSTVGSNGIILLTNGGTINGSGHLINSGIIENTGGGTDSIIAAPLINSGTVNVQDGVLILQGGGDISGVLSTQGSGEVRLYNSSFTFEDGMYIADSSYIQIWLSFVDVPAGASVSSGAGSQVDIHSASTLTINAGATLTSHDFYYIGAATIITGEGDHVVNGTLYIVFAAPPTLSGSGTTRVTSSGTLQLQHVMLSGRTLINESTSGSSWYGNDITVSNGGQLINSGNLSITGTSANILQGAGLPGVFSNSGTITYLRTGTTNIDVPFVNNEGSVLDLQDGILNFNADLQNEPGALIQGDATVQTADGGVTNDGGVAPGNSIGILNWDGNFEMSSASASLDIELGGTTPGNTANAHDQLAISGIANVVGTLNVRLYDGFTPSYGDSFEILTCLVRSGTFNTENLPALSGGVGWDVIDYGDTSGVTLSVTHAYYCDEDGDGYIAALSSGGCDQSVDNSCVPALCQDKDNPGDDCDDGAATVNPGATETLYNGIDDDCDPFTVDHVWTITTAISGTVSDYSIAIDNSDNLHIAYQEGGDLKYATNASGIWVSETVQSEWTLAGGGTGDPLCFQSVGYGASIAVDNLGDIHIIYGELYVGCGDPHFHLRLAQKDNSGGSGAWGSIQIAVGPNARTAIAADSSGNPHYLYVTGISDTLQYSGGGSFPNNSATDFSIAVDSSDKIHISFAGGLVSNELVYATNNGVTSGSGDCAGASNFNCVTIDNAGGSGTYSSIAVDQYQNVHIAYSTSTASLAYATNSAVTAGSANCPLTGYYCETIQPSVSGGYSVALNGDFPFISYLPVGGDRMHASLTSGIWVTETVESATAPGPPDMVVDLEGYSHIIYPGSLKYATNSPGVCGNGIIEGIETCDDGNTVDGDGCGATCIFEGECGDGIVQIGEECDDGNINDGDGCEADCTFLCVDGDGDGYGLTGTELGGCAGSTTLADCDDNDLTEFPGGLWYWDADGDGYTEGSTISACERQPDFYRISELTDFGDCNDGDPNIFPGAAPNDSATDCMKDTDGDDWGDDTPGTGFTPGTDCDDNDPQNYPGNSEVCDGQDNDCNGQSDDGLPDADSDGAGDACDQCPNDPDDDIDADSVCGDVDTCPTDYNPETNWTDINAAAHTDEQEDYDQDGVYDACDNCPGVANPGQENADGDERGDACDGSSEPAPRTCKRNCDPPPPPPEEDPCPGDTDDDSDDVCDAVDNCPNVSNGSQADSDNDNRGDACDKDYDNDHYCDEGTTFANYEYYDEQCSPLGAGDCNDSVNSINPGVDTDISDGLDNNCNGLIDEDAGLTMQVSLTDAGGSPIDRNTWTPDKHIDGQIKVIARVFDGATEVTADATFVYEVLDASNHTGKYTNDTTGGLTDDFGYNAADLGDGNNTVTLSVNDYGAAIKLRITASVVGDTPNLIVTIPEDSDWDMMADTWENEHGGTGLAASVDTDFDGIKNIDEYRSVRWGKMISCTDIENPSFTDSTLADPVHRTALVAQCSKYSNQTEAYLATGTTFLRLDPTRKDLFVKYFGFGTYTYSGVAVDFPFALGPVFYNSGVDVHASEMTDTYNPSASLGSNNIDVLQIDLGDTALFSSGRTQRLGTRRWEYATLGASCKGNSERFGDDSWHHSPSTSNCDITGVNVYRTAIYYYFKDSPFIDGNGEGSPVCSYGGISNTNAPNNVLESLSNIDDRDDDGILDGGEARKTCGRSDFDGDRMIRSSSSCSYPDCTLGQQLTANDIDADGNIELPRASDPDSLTSDSSAVDNQEYTLEQVVKHVTSHELGHGLGMPHNSIGSCLMYEYTSDWERDDTFSSVALSDLFIHNDNLNEKIGGE